MAGHACQPPTGLEIRVLPNGSRQAARQSFIVVSAGLGFLPGRDAAAAARFTGTPERQGDQEYRSLPGAPAVHERWLDSMSVAAGVEAFSGNNPQDLPAHQIDGKVRMASVLKWVGRKRRIIGRIINRKSLPRYTYRWDSRAPATIRMTGFQPWNGGGNISLIEHVNNAYGPGHARAGQQTKHDSQWVSTGGYGMLKKLDPTFAQQVLNSNLYKIDTAIALQTGNFVDANDYFDRAGIDRPYATQREWVKLGGIDQAAVVEYMPGRDYYRQLNHVTWTAPDEDQLQYWQAF